MQRLITVTEGMPAIIVEEKLAANPYPAGPAPTIAEGSVLPDSYGYQRGETRAALVARMQAAMSKTVAALWPKRSTDCPVVTPEQAVTLASIVEKETGKASERPMIAGVYCNRLRIGMKLDADPTVIYPVTKGKPLGRRILKSELNADNGYNTYRSAGLAGGADRQSGQGEHRGGASSGTDQGALFRRRRHRRPCVRRHACRSIKPMSPNGMRSAASGGRCEEPRHWPGRMFMGGLLLFAAVITWGTALMMSPHGESMRHGTEHVRTTVVTFLRNSAIGTLVLCALAGWLLFPAAAAALAGARLGDRRR